MNGVYTCLVTQDLAHLGMFSLSRYDCIYLCAPQVGRAGRFGTKGLAITFVASETDSGVLNSVQVCLHLRSRHTYKYPAAVAACSCYSVPNNRRPLVLHIPCPCQNEACLQKHTPCMISRTLPGLQTCA